MKTVPRLESLLLTSAVFVTVSLAGCSPSFQGIRLRAQHPPINEAYRKITLALTVDGYVIAGAQPSRFTAETAWRDAKANERSDADKVPPANEGPVESRLEVRLERRGMLYDVYFTPMLRYGGPSGTIIIAGIRHPLREKWEKALSALVEREAKEED